MAKLKLNKVDNHEQMTAWINELENADGILPDNDFRWWQCPQCYHQGRHSGYHYRTMLRKPVEVDGTLAFVLRDLVVDKLPITYDKHLFNMWEKEKIEYPDFTKWITYHVKSWQMVKAACQILDKYK